jgi:hypothetical protein
MSTGVKLFGHSLHPILIVFPLGLLGGAVFFELFYYLTGSPEFAVVTFWLIVGGLIGGAVAAPFGWIDWFAIPAAPEQKPLVSYTERVLSQYLFSLRSACTCDGICQFGRHLPRVPFLRSASYSLFWEDGLAANWLSDLVLAFTREPTQTLQVRSVSIRHSMVRKHSKFRELRPFSGPLRFA